MCCFSQPVQMVANTNIFARADGDRQFLVYSMSYAAPDDLAMVLPLPVPPESPEDAVRFINLEAYPKFFDDLSEGFPPPSGMFATLGEPTKSVASPPPLRVHDVGEFEASFVPRADDFDRLEPRFRISREVWDLLPAYRDFGFAVFKLKGGAPKADAGGWLTRTSRALFGGPAEPHGSVSQRVHPMAFSFPRRDPSRLYFPTVHIHDGKVHPRALFDHMLYCQLAGTAEAALPDWDTSSWPAGEFVEVALTQGVIDPQALCLRVPLTGRRENRDVLVGAGESLPARR